MQHDEQTLKTCIQELEDSIKAMTEDAANAARLYVTNEDIASLPCTANETVFAVKAPQGTTLEVPDPDEGLASGQRRYRYHLSFVCFAFDRHLFMAFHGGAPIHVTSVCSGCIEPNHDVLCRIILKSKCDVPIDVWLVNANHKDQRQGVQQHDEQSQPVLPAVPAHHQANLLEGEQACHC